MAESLYESTSQLSPVLAPAGSDRLRAAGAPTAAGEPFHGPEELIISDEEQRLRLEEGLDDATDSVERLNAAVIEKDERKARVLSELSRLREKIREAGVDSVVEMLLMLLQSVKVLERQELALKSDFELRRSELETQIRELEEKISGNYDGESLSDDLDQSICTASKNSHTVKKELSTSLRAVLSLKRQLDHVPSQSELTQYECRLEELNMNIGEKDRQTRKFYSTYNALLEIKELMLKEISLLNSINSQFQDAIASTTGQTKLLDSMEGILKGIQQKLEKVQVGLQAEQNVCDTLRKRYAAAVADQRRSFTILKALQEQRERNEKLQRQIYQPK